MKKLHFLILKTFTGPFLLTLFIEFGVIAELVGYASLNQIPLSLPLAILLSSIMTYGKLGETVELTAIKSLGISLWRAMLPLIIVVLLLSVGAFFFSNNILPKSNRNLKMLLHDISTKKPELSIPEGIFYQQLDGYTIRVGKKYKDKTLKDVIIFENENNSNRFITADSGKMETANNDSLLVLTLINGNAYDQESEADKGLNQKSYPLVHNRFKENQIIFNLASFQFVRTDEKIYSNNSKMQSVTQLQHSVDSMSIQMKKRQTQLFDDLNRNFFFRKDSTVVYDTLTPYPFKSQDVLSHIEPQFHKQVVTHAIDIARNAKNYIHSGTMVLDNQYRIQNKYLVEYHRKFTLSFACLLLFFIGAPFGAIVKKGGLGAPVVISVFLFLSFHVLSIVGEKLAKNGSWEAYEGMWLAAVVLTPIGLFLTYKATSDSALFNAHWYKKQFKKLFKNQD